MNFGLIGKSISHSFSKTYFEQKFLVGGYHEFRYFNFDVENLHSLKEIIVQHSLSGLNITKPYKYEVINYLDEIDPIAEIIGAVNCIKVIYKKEVPYLIGYNTDCYGFSQSIKPFLEPMHQKALILGTGGAAKAVAHALKNIGVEIYYVTRAEKRGPNYFNYHELNSFVLNSFKLIVNCTPLGLYPNVNECPDLPFEFVTKDHLLYDLIYNPTQTLFLEKGKQKNATIINGLNMLKLQADKAWEIWNG